ncbi:hypothetical protein EX30DRAFT_248370 [Ascodesmis nigricans]|uniref:Uncharacterized protein n=1 Tax=Ascodesmis nigricans TaxID=341454 RepID=A0A4S2MMN5_9PEZI|nr:hypothetical protein EX30DRAFT_248370 [Ascodesmis nigricans]
MPPYHHISKNSNNPEYTSPIIPYYTSKSTNPQHPASKEFSRTSTHHHHHHHHPPRKSITNDENKELIQFKFHFQPSSSSPNP